jgi:hypothetical protein
MSPEECELLCDSSGGPYDSGNWSTIGAEDYLTLPTGFSLATGNDAFAGVGPNILNTPHSRMYNPGASARREMIRLNLRADSGKPATAAYGATEAVHKVGVGVGEAENTLLIRFTERVPIHPFFFYESRDRRESIPNIRTFDLSIIFTAKLIQTLFQSCIPLADLGRLEPVDAYLHLKWYIPPMTVKIPPSVSLPIFQPKVYRQGNLLSAVFADKLPSSREDKNPGREIMFNNIRLEQIPDLLLIYMKPDYTQYLGHEGTEDHVSIQKLNIVMEGDSGKIYNASSVRLYHLWLRNCAHKEKCKIKYRDWRDYICTVALRPRDLGFIEAPGVNKMITFSITITVFNSSVYSSPRGAITALGREYGKVHAADGLSYKRYTLYVVPIHERWGLTLNADGGSALRLQKVPPMNRAGLSAPSVAQGSLNALPL